jgi:hypothetical protein
VHIKRVLIGKATPAIRAYVGMLRGAHPLYFGSQPRIFLLQCRQSARPSARPVGQGAEWFRRPAILPIDQGKGEVSRPLILGKFLGVL